MKKIISIFLCLNLLLTGFCVFAQKPAYQDIENHWAENVISAWSDFGIFGGYDGNFFPEKPITRGEFATVFNRILQLNTPSENTFVDLGENYYTEPILCLNRQGIMNGFENEMRPDAPISRQEAGVMLAKALFLPQSDSVSDTFLDWNLASDWAKPFLATLVEKGYLHGNEGYLKPLDAITRAETVALLDHAVFLADNIMQERGIEKVCIVSRDYSSFRNCTFSENVIVTPNVTKVSFETVKFYDTLQILTEAKGAVSMIDCEVRNLVTANEQSLAGEEPEASEEGEALEEKTETILESEEIAPSQDEVPPVEEGGGDEVVEEETKPVITTTLEDGLLQRNSKKVFDVIARDKNGDKIPCSVRFNDINIEPSWDDESKTSFTLEFSDSGEYTVSVTATDSEGNSRTESYRITYEMAEYGEAIGKAIVCVEAFTVGLGYVVAPMEVDVCEGINCAYLLDELLTEQGLSYLNSGSWDGGFYLSSIGDIGEFTPNISETLASALSDAGFTLDPEGYTQNQLTEFDFTSGSGWMYCVNNVFPNVGFSEYYLQDGDVMRVQFTIALGSDIGGVSGGIYTYAGDFFDFVNRDELTKKIASVGIANCQDYLDLIGKPDLTESELSSVMENLQ